MALAQYSVDIDLIPHPSTMGCNQKNYYKEGLGGCGCEDHCRWDLCRLDVAPNECLQETFSEWQWDNVKSAWVAQVVEGTNVQMLIEE